MKYTIITVIVTFNRKQLLRRALNAHLNQTCKASHLLIVDNASTDGTREMLQKEGWLDQSDIELLPLQENTGGAGGFAAGLEHAINSGADWVWMMDDDAEPHTTALEQLIRIASDPRNIYGSLAVNLGETSWLTTVLDPPLGEVSKATAVPTKATVESLPFLGFMVHRELVERIGLPDVDFFIAADDVEYCVRAQRAGAELIIAGKSRIEHPRSRPQKVQLLGKSLTFLPLPPWKRYYDTRNRLLIARKYYGTKIWTQTLPGSIVRLFASVVREPRKREQLQAVIAGIIDGLAGIKGQRHEFWKLRP